MKRLAMIFPLGCWAGRYGMFRSRRPFRASGAVLFTRKVLCPFIASDIPAGALASKFDPGLWIHIPQDDRMIGAARGQELAIRAESGAHYEAGMPCER